MTVTIYHNPRCSKSRQTLDLVEARGITPKVVEYLKHPPSAAELKAILKKLGIKPRAWSVEASRFMPSSASRIASCRKTI
jgi:arsenate reductase (glutaredoxin)